jgi:hypothetical protein
MSVVWWCALVGLGPTLAAQQPIPGPPNDCGHPHWRETLRCRALALAGSSDAPQANEGSRPDEVGDLKEYTRVFFGGPALRCLDGTRPVLYVAPAVCTNPAGCPQSGGVAAFGAPIQSNDWLVSFTGGGACHAVDTDGDGVYDDGTTCTAAYAGERGEMSSAFDPPMRNLGGSARTSGGILSRNPVVNPRFAGYNSVRVEKCSYDRYLGRSEHADLAGEIGGRGFTYTLFNHGQRIAEAAIREIRNGLRFTTWADVDRDGQVDEIEASLPPLRSARQVVFIGHSGAAHGLRHTIDRLAVLARGDREVDVRLVLDANFLPSLEGEAAFSGLGGDAYSDQWTGTSSGTGVAFDYDGERFHHESLVPAQLVAWQTTLDDSCMAAHAPETRWKCRDRQHVTFNHLSTPMFIREDYLDRNTEHTDDMNGHPVPWALAPGCSYASVLPGSPCDVRFAPLTEHRARLTGLATTLLSAVGTRSEHARRLDRSLRPGQVPSIFLWMPVCGSHEGAYSSEAFFGTAIVEGASVLSMAGALEQFLAAPAFGAIDWRIHGAVGGRTMTARCP